MSLKMKGKIEPQRCPSSGPAGHLLPVRTAEKGTPPFATILLLPAACGEKVPAGG